ncbi:energy transducer TonB [Luteimonas sp. 22616]|uniref:energy transducer TonB n=1 Tax=Luteimonas sp. 22616 TaxID=3453951 RepID=UPI003F847D28
MRLVIVVLAALCCVATAASKQPETIDVWLRAGVDIDASGHVQDLQWEEQSKVHALIAERLAPVVRGWEFEPATVDGRPAPTQTGLVIHVLVDELADGSVTLRLADAQTGPTASTLMPPTYPMDAARGGISATVKLVVEVKADGSPVIREMTYESSDDKRSGYRDAFFASATEAAKHWKFRPEIVAGRVVPGSSVRIPIDYCLGTASQCQRNQRARDVERKLPTGLYQGEASAVALKTDIRKQAI